MSAQVSLVPKFQLSSAAALLVCTLPTLSCTVSARDDYPDWQKSGTIFIDTTPLGANLPASASLEGFPLLVRLHKDYFDFSKALPNGDDVRFSNADGKPLAFQIEHWSVVEGAASIWVRMPQIRGNKRQELRMHWGNATASGESNGGAVFNESNGYLTVLHMGEKPVDEVGTVTPEDEKTSATAGMVGTARHFAGGQGIFCGEQITKFPVGAAPHSTEAWVRAEKVNGRVMAWGNEHGQGKVVMHFMSPPHVKMECYFSGADVASERLPMNEWTHIFHTYENGSSLIYINGVLSGTSKTPNAPLAIKSPARLYIGGWYSNWDFHGDVDEVRISEVTRSADWVKLQYENQKPLQSATGPVVTEQTSGLKGTKFVLAPAEAAVAEGKTALFTLDAPHAQKVYWTVKSDGIETIEAVDRFAFTFNAGRVTGDKKVMIECRAVIAGRMEIKEIHISVREAIPDPVFTLKAQKSWDGRKATDVLIETAGNTGEAKTTWSAGPFAVSKETTTAGLRLTRAQNSGTLTVSATMDNGGQPVTQSVSIEVTEPKSDPWVTRTPDKNEKPMERQFYARDDRNEGTLFWNGILTEAADKVFLKLYADKKLIHTDTAAPAADRSYSLSAKLKPGLIRYKAEFGISNGANETVKEIVSDLVCGDVFIINGQSNALATDTGEKSPAVTSEWIRSYGRPEGDGKLGEGNLWCRPVWKAQNGEKAELGWWGMELAKQLVDSQKVPVFIVNAAVGGTRIDQHQRSMSDPSDLRTIYGRMLWRVQQAKLTHGIRAILWHQGENDQGADGPSGGYGWETYQKYFLEMSAGWKHDFPNVQHYYVFQIWPNSCAMGGSHGSGDMLREKQRTLPQLFSRMSIMSTLGIVPPGPCHYPLLGWSEIAHLVQPMIERDLYAKKPVKSITPPNLVWASLGEDKDKVVLEFDQPVKWKEALAGQFYLDGEKGKIATGSVAGNVVTLQLKEPSSATRITYLKEVSWNQITLLEGENGIAALTFCNVPVRTNQ